MRLSRSQYNAPLLFILKKTRKIRMNIDYSMLNKNTRLDMYLIPSVNDFLDKLAKVTIFIIIELTTAYYQVSIKDGHRYKTTFLSIFGLYTWVV